MGTPQLHSSKVQQGGLRFADMPLRKRAAAKQKETEFSGKKARNSCCECANGVLAFGEQKANLMKAARKAWISRN
jgi:hypothetical protein